MKKRLSSESGVALIVTLWILLILSVIALGFSIELHLEARMARYQLDNHVAYYLAKAGIERAMVELKNDVILDNKSRPAKYDSIGDSWGNNEDTREIFQEVELGEGTYNVHVLDEYSKLNINKANKKMFEGLFRALDFDDEDSEYYANAIIDFRDTDDGYTEDTAMTELEFYYGPDVDTTSGIQYFNNKDFISPEELLKVPTFNIDILYSIRQVYGFSDKKVRLIDLLTVHGDGSLNVNTASLPAIAAVIISLGEDDTEEAVTIAQSIIDKRDGSDDEDGTTDDKPYTNPAEVASELGSLNPALASRLGSTFRTISDLFRITSVGEVSRAKKKVEALVRREFKIVLLTDEERKLIENESKGGLKEEVRLQIVRWMEF